MKFTSKERIGLRAMVELAHHYGQGPTALSDIAQAQGLPLPYLEQIARRLRRAGLLDSVRGARGGYALTRDPGSITVGDVFRAVEGSLICVDCVRTEGSCDRAPVCETRLVWQTLLERLGTTLDRTSLADILRHDTLS